ncbi:UPF0187-domain-containing protein [Macrolepiota fuliginosa MF-IS2]|uniref:UPF0187-domain-containing protein n=1 Tax=Macrolepiota fuliginosa MF-IS2 TaxID=1400762 RepID=A0A9P5X9M8_9AGAR|nr:UPF0187-domain-containing protein [Macrolepiota fuliginosa MF-IS2]
MSAQNHPGSHRSTTGNHNLLPAFRPNSAVAIIPPIPKYSLLTWSFGRGSVIWRIWPAVLLHTAFAAAIVTLTMRGVVNLKIPTVMLTVLGVVIGFVISYRAGSGYDRYWMGRTCWSDVIKNSRTMGRLIWFHVPPRLSPKTPEETETGRSKRSVGEMKKVMAEKKMALDLVEGFAVALKHHIRGELGVYYQDLYHLVKPLHDHDHSVNDYNSPLTTKTAEVRFAPPRKNGTAPASEHVIATNVSSPVAEDIDLPYTNPVIPAINAYGTFNPSNLRPHHHAHGSSSPSSSSSNDHVPLLASNQPPRDRSLLSKVSRDLIPFAGVLSGIRGFFKTDRPHPSLEGDQNANDPFHPNSGRSWRGPIYSGLHTKHRPYVAGGGENLPVEILRHLSNWLGALEDRGTVPGTSLGQMVGALAAFEDNLTTLERILTTPLPFVYSVHIRHTVWIYLFFLPFQLVDQFGWFTIPGVAMAAFIYLGFVAAGEEIEQPFGYDENDLDLDLFCREIIHCDIKHLKTTPCVNAYLGPEIERRPDVAHRQSMTLIELADRHGEELY